MDKAAEPTEQHFLDHPEIREFFRTTFVSILEESDRGAVIIAADVVDAHLRRMFESLAPKSISQKQLKDLLGYPGPLATLRGEADLAFLSRLIPDHIHAAVTQLRHLRNDVAHSPRSFHLKDHDGRVRRIYELGPGVPRAVNRWACEFLVHNLVGRLAKSKWPSPEDDKPLFEGTDAILDYLSGKPEFTSALDEKRPRTELALGIGLLCALIVHERECTLRALDGRHVWSLEKETRCAPRPC